MKIAVVDGQGGGIGRSLIEKIKEEIQDATVVALGTNSAATGVMMRAGADRGATGENAIIYNMSRVDVVVGAVGIIAANALMGEVTPRMAAAIADSPAQKVLLPLNRCGIIIAGLAEREASLGYYIDDAVKAIKRLWH